MKLVDVPGSSSITGIGYDPQKRVMHIRFVSGDTYAYHDVDPVEHARLIAAESKGKHHHQNFRGQAKYAARKLTGEEIAA